MKNNYDKKIAEKNQDFIDADKKNRLLQQDSVLKVQQEISADRELKLRDLNSSPKTIQQLESDTTTTTTTPGNSSANSAPAPVSPKPDTKTKTS